MLKGFYMTLLVGPGVPVPVPESVLDALVSVTVTNTAKRRTPSGFELKFTLGTRSPLHTIFLLAGGSLPPVMRCIVVVTFGGMPEVLIDGVITKQQVSPGADAGHSTLTVTGVDLTALMNLIEFTGLPYPAMPPEARVLLMLVKYAAFGIVPLVIPSFIPDVSIPTAEIPVQKGNDLQYIFQLADNTGYVFYLTAGPVPGASVAYWGPEVKVGIPQPALNTNMNAHTNVESIKFEFDAEHKVLPLLMIHNAITKVPIPIPVPDITPLSPPLGAIPPLPKKILRIKRTAKLNLAQAAMLGLATAARSGEAVTATGTLDVPRYGRVLKARQLVGVRGAGTAFDGLYYVRSVTHLIKRGEYKQNFTLTRNGLVSTLPAVPA